jgi:hypothetical protein
MGTSEVANPPTGPEPEAAVRSRRSLLAAALGGLGAVTAAVFGTASRTKAAAGTPLIIGSQANDAGAADTQLLTNSNVIAFKLLQNGPGTGLMGYATPGVGGTRGVYGRSDSPDGDGVQARNAGAAGTGAGMRAFGGNNSGLEATTANAGRFAVKATNTSVASSGGGAVQGDGGQNIGVSGFSANSAWYGVAGSNFNSAGTGIRADGGATSGVGLLAYGANAVVGFSATPTYAAVYGEHTASSGGNYGVYGKVDSTDSGATGVAGSDSGGTSQSNGVTGTSSATLGNGVLGTNLTNDANAYGVYGVGSAAGYGVVASGDMRCVGDFTATGSKAGYVVDVAVNGSSATLRQGDAVTLLGVRPAVLGAIPLLVVGPANAGDTVIGVVDRQVEVTPANKQDAGMNHVKGKGTIVEPEEHLYVVTLGAFAVASADASAGAIKAGHRLVAGANGKLVKANPVQLDGRSFYAPGEQVGYALGELATGSGTMGIFVRPH